MPSRVQTNPKYSPSTVEEATNSILEFLSSDGTDETLHEHALSGLHFLEQDRSNMRMDTHKMRMALALCRTDKIMAKVRKTS